MSKLISGKEALIALANGESVQKRSDSWAGDHWFDISKKEPFNLDCFLSGLNIRGETIKFRIKPRTITINGVEVVAPFEPKLGERYYVLQPCNESGWMGGDCADMEFDRTWSQFGAWRTEDEIKQVVAALRSVFKPQ